MKLRIVQIILLGLCSALFSPSTWAAGIFDLVCNGVHLGPIAFVGPSSGILACPAALINGLNGRPGGVNGGADQTDAGLNFFIDGVALNIDLSQVAQGSANTFTAEAVSFPAWTPPPPPLIPTVLVLTGRAQIPDPTGSFNVNLSGLLGGPVPALLVGNFDHNNCNQCTLSGASFRDQLRAGVADETLTINTVGRVVYRTSSPTFEGAIPEPETLSLMTYGLSSLFVVLALRSRSSVARSRS